MKGEDHPQQEDDAERLIGEFSQWARARRLNPPPGEIGNDESLLPAVDLFSLYGELRGLREESKRDLKRNMDFRDEFRQGLSEIREMLQMKDSRQTEGSQQDDLDAEKELLDLLIDELRKTHSIDLRENRRAVARLSRAVEEAKKRLSFEPFVRIEEEAIAEKKGEILNISRELSRHEYEELILPEIQGTLLSIRTALKDAQVSPGELDRIILVGGSTRTPLVSGLIEREFGIAPRHEINPDLCVAMGAAIQGAIIDGSDVNRVLVDITPYSFGTSAVAELDGMFYPEVYVPLIKKNSALPCSYSEVFYTLEDYQDAVEVKVYQGEHRDALKNILIGRFMVEDLNRVPAGNEIVFHMDLDVNGILNVKAEEKRTGRSRQLKIRNAFKPTEIIDLEASRKRLRAIEGGAPLLRAPAALPDAGAKSGDIPEKLSREAGSLIERARKILDQISPEDRDEVIQSIEAIEESRSLSDAARLKNQAEELKELLFYLE